MSEPHKDLQSLNNARNTRIVKELFALLNSNDIPAVLARLTGDIDWHSPVTNTITPPVSWAKRRRNRAEVAAFFEELSRKIRTFEMRQLTFMSRDDRVVVEGSTHGVVEATGRDYLTNWVMVITLKNGKVSKLRHYYDTADIVKAFQAAGAYRKAA